MRAASDQKDAERAGMSQRWVPPGLGVIAGIWLLGTSSHYQQGLDVAYSEWTLGAGWGRWLQISREGMVSAGEVSWEGFSVSFVADWLLLVPLALLVFGLSLCLSTSFRVRVLKLWRKVDSLHGLRDQLPAAVTAALLTMLVAALLFPGQQRTEIVLTESENVAAARQSFEPSLLDRSAVRSYDFRADEQGAVMVEVVTRSWPFRKLPTTHELVPNLRDQAAFLSNVERSVSEAAIPFGVLIGLLVLLAPLYRRSG